MGQIGLVPLLDGQDIPAADPGGLHDLFNGLALPLSFLPKQGANFLQRHTLLRAGPLSAPATDVEPGSVLALNDGLFPQLSQVFLKDDVQLFVVQFVVYLVADLVQLRLVAFLHVH